MSWKIAWLHGQEVKHFPQIVTVDGSRAGSGNLEILVNGGRVTSSVRALGSQRFIASFTSHEAGMHTVQITFNGDTVPGERWLFFCVCPLTLIFEIDEELNQKLL